MFVTVKAQTLPRYIDKMFAVYGQGALSEETIQKWCVAFVLETSIWKMLLVVGITGNIDETIAKAKQDQHVNYYQYRIKQF